MSDTVYFKRDITKYRPGYTSDIWSHSVQTTRASPFALFRGLIVSEDTDVFHINVGSYRANKVITVPKTKLYYSDDNLSEFECIYNSKSHTDYDNLYEIIDTAIRINKVIFYRCTSTEKTTRVQGHYWLTHKVTNEIIDASAIRDYDKQSRGVVPQSMLTISVRNGVKGLQVHRPFIYKSHGVIDATEVLQAKHKRVRLHNLSKKSLNGSIGTILTSVCKPGRTAVILDGEQKPISVNKKNLKMLDAPELPDATSSTDYRLHQLITDPTRDSSEEYGRCFIEVSAACDLLDKPNEWNINYGTIKMEVGTNMFLGYDATYDLVPGHLPCAPLLELRNLMARKLDASTSGGAASAGASKFILRM